MNNAAKNASARILVVGRSPGVLVDTVEILRSKGYSADATNQFDQVLDDYDVTNIDVLVFGGMVPPDTKQYLREQIGERNPQVTFVQGLAGIAGLIAAQVEEVVAPSEPDDGQIAYDAARRSVELTLNGSMHVSVHAWWGTSFTPPEPKSTSMEVFDGELPKGFHSIPLRDRVPFEASFATVAVGSSVRAFTVGAMPNAVTRMVPTSAADQRLPEVSHVTTRSDDW
jgi:hypothetical protein